MTVPIWAGMTSQTDPRAFLYRDGALDPATVQRLTADLLGKCDDGELYLQYSASESFGFDDGRLKTADYSTDAGFGLRGKVVCGAIAKETDKQLHLLVLQASATNAVVNQTALLEGENEICAAKRLLS